jgi:CheY-like chemotaxis protein
MNQTCVLVVDDSPINQMIMVELLETMNICVHTANNGQEAIKCIEKEAYDIVFMDLEMPVMNGHEAVVHIRQTLKFYQPIIALTAHDKSSITKTLSKEGFSGFLKKPLDDKQLSALVHSICPT